MLPSLIAQVLRDMDDRSIGRMFNRAGQIILDQEREIEELRAELDACTCRDRRDEVVSISIHGGSHVQVGTEPQAG